jgi:hypothetical protein
MTEADLRAIERRCEAIMDSDLAPSPECGREHLIEYEAMLDIIEQDVPRLIAAVRRLGGGAS